MDNRNLLTLFLFFLIPGITLAQSDRYKMDFYPDAWYNEIDGIRLGVRVLGEMEGTFLDGPHRLDTGVWLSTWIPDLPVSYYTSLTEPIPVISSYGSEGNIRLMSSIRTGYSQHEVSFNKRWQTGFNEFDFHELSASFGLEKMFDVAYRPYPQLWQSEWRNLFGLKFWISREFEPGLFNLKTSVDYNMRDTFSKADIELIQQINLSKGFELSLRGFSGYLSKQAPPEYYYGRSFRPANEWLENRVTRAKGTLPNPWLDDGLFHINGGTNLRGYTRQDFDMLATTNRPLIYDFVASFNAEIAFPNPVNAFLNNTIVTGLIDFRSYLFGDTGVFYRDNYAEPGADVLNDVINRHSDAGVGFQFSINIPNYLGKDRGFAIRYEIPIWLSHPPANENNIKFRNLIGIGAVISL